MKFFELFGVVVKILNRDQFLTWISEALAKNSVSPSWLGYDEVMGWILLDRLIPGNTNTSGDAQLTFIKLLDLSLVKISKSVWNSGEIFFYRTYLNRLNQSTFPQVCERDVQAQFLIWLDKRPSILEATNIQIRDFDRDFPKPPDKISRIAAHLVREKLPRKFASPPLSNEDISLCLAWSNTIGVPANELQNSLNALGEWDACRLISARQAELVTLKYLRSLGYEASDVSHSQLNEMSDRRWKDFDIDAGYPIDVKNARGSYSADIHFLEHCVARFKADRKTHLEVKIFGAISEYQNNIDRAREGGTTVTLLGEVGISSINNLAQWFSSRFNGIFDLSGLWNEKSLPGWLYEFPNDHYSERAEARKLATELVGIYQSEATEFKALPGWVCVISEAINTICLDSFEPEVRRIINDLRSLIACDGIALRAIYLYLMGCTLEAVINGVNPSKTIVNVTEVTRFYFRGKESWLGVADPCGYLNALVGTVGLVGENLLASKRKFVAFRLVHPYILKGVEDNGNILSVVAYCGGWQSEPVVKCGYAPLVIGAHQHCSDCGRLICNECGFCFKTCSKCSLRQTSSAKIHSNSDDIEPSALDADIHGDLRDEYWASLGEQ